MCNITYSKTEGEDWRQESPYHEVGVHHFQKIKAVLSQISYMCGMECGEWTGLSAYLIWGRALHDETKNAWLHRKLTEEALGKNIKFVLWNLRNKWYSAKQKFCKEASFDDNTTGFRPKI